MLKWLRNRKARRTQERVDVHKKTYRKLSPEGRQRLYMLVAIGAGSIYHKQEAIDICDAAREVEDEEQKASIEKGQETTPFRSVTLH